ncbi:hypothetical protein GX50_01727 [[Emmonsia] crescens]|uniref:Uncharacterized protein n=1 Tax=[Emmonsia] crescens TaxID=73230 RepID=A0A2B7ZQE3_9EURO|nr:hypothetical protein GX50_01727 [Emmonsia crescens]
MATLKISPNQAFVSGKGVPVISSIRAYVSSALGTQAKVISIPAQLEIQVERLKLSKRETEKVNIRPRI